jgi:DNA-binding GntR family transcriptional regulator
VDRGDPLHARVYDLLWARLTDGELPAGTRLKDTEWAARLGVSRTPVREAFRKLAHDGALEPLGPGGYQVRRFTAEEIGEIYRCRAALEALAAEEAARNGKALRRELAANITAAEAALAADDLEALQRLNGAFHDAVLDASGNSHLRRLLEQTRRVVHLARRQVLARTAAGEVPSRDYRDSLTRVIDDHRALQAALAREDAAQAAVLMRSHLLATAQHMADLLVKADARRQGDAA